MIVLDASVLIAHLDANDAHHDRATEVLADSSDQPWAASPLSLAEVLVGPARAGGLEDAQAVLRRLDVATVPLDDEAPARLAVLRAETRLKLPDCCVLLSAEQTRGEVATFDEQLAYAAGQRNIAVRSDGASIASAMEGVAADGCGEHSGSG